MSRPKGSTLEVRRAHAMALQMYLKKFTFTALLVNFGKYLVGCLSISRSNKEFTCFRKDPLVRGIMIMSLPLGDRLAREKQLQIIDSRFGFADVLFRLCLE
jgi:hypothetical protein